MAAAIKAETMWKASITPADFATLLKPLPDETKALELGAGVFIVMTVGLKGLPRIPSPRWTS